MPDPSHPNRRSLLKVSLSMSAVFLAGCGGSSGADKAPGVASEPPSTVPPPNPPSPAPEPAPAPVPEPTPAPSPEPPPPEPPPAPAPGPAGVARFAVRGSLTGLQPFAFGHPFRQGDIPAGLVAIGDCTDWQCVPLTYWPDGSLKHAIVAGRVSVTTGAATSIALAAGPTPGGVPLSETDLAAALPATTIAVDGDLTTLNALVGTGALHTTVCTGPVMSSWVYRRPVGGSSHLVVYAEVRLFKGGAVEIFPWIENGYLTVAGPTNFVRTCVVTIGSVQKFNQVIDIKHHTRVPLFAGSSFGYWTVADPGMTPVHDTTYCMATKVVPKLGWGAPRAATLDALQQSYAPNTLAGDTAADGSAGGSGSVISRPSAMYLTSGADVRAYKAMMVHGLSSGSWSHHYRDQNTNLPLSFATWWDASIVDSGSQVVPIGTGGANASGPSMSHATSYAYLPWLVTGRWWFLEELHFWATYAFLAVGRSSRNGADSLYWGPQPRTRAWSLSVLAQAAASTPPSHPLSAGFVAAWQANTAKHRRRFVDGLEGSIWVHPQGFMGDYSDTGSSIYYPSFRRRGNGVQTAFETYGVRDISTYTVMVDNGSVNVTKNYGTDWTVAGTSIVFATAPASGADIYVRPNANQWWCAPWQHHYLSTVFGYTADIGIPQSAQSLADHVAVRDHAYQSQIQSAGDGVSGFSWRQFTRYIHPMGEDMTGLPLETNYTSARSYAAYLAELGLPPSDPTPGNTLLVGDAPLADGESGRAYAAPGIAALALAVAQGVPGAAAAYGRITGASNYASALTNYLTNERPDWGIVPQ